MFAIWSKGTFGVDHFWNRVHVMPGTIRTETTSSDIKVPIFKNNH